MGTGSGSNFGGDGQPGDAEVPVPIFSQGLRRRWFATAAVGLVAVLMYWSWSQARVRRDLQTLCECALVAEPNDPVIHYNLGNLWKSKSQLDRAIAQFRQVLRHKPDSTRTYNNLGWVGRDWPYGHCPARIRSGIRWPPQLARPDGRTGLHTLHSPGG